jgi:hypothetical protein
MILTTDISSDYENNFLNRYAEMLQTSILYIILFYLAVLEWDLVPSCARPFKH